MGRGPFEHPIAPLADPKIGALAEMLANNPDYMVTIESHTDNTGSAEVTQTVTDARAKLLTDKFTTLGIQGDHLRAKGFGAGSPPCPTPQPQTRLKIAE